jgi:hypothetical protein
MDLRVRHKRDRTLQARLIENAAWVTTCHMRRPLSGRSASALAGFRLVIGLAFGLGLFQAQAAIYTFNLSGNLNNLTTFGYTDSLFQYDQWELPVTGMPPFQPVQGDVIDATITLDRNFTVPASPPGSILFLQLRLLGFAVRQNSVGASTTAAFFNEGVPGYSTPTATGAYTSGALAAGVMICPPYYSPITFDQVSFHSVITQLESGTFLRLDGARLGSSLMIPVPEPGSLSLVAAGLSGLTLTKWRRKKVSQTKVNQAELSSLPLRLSEEHAHHNSNRASQRTRLL